MVIEDHGNAGVVTYSSRLDQMREICRDTADTLRAIAEDYGDCQYRVRLADRTRLSAAVDILLQGANRLEALPERVVELVE